MEPSPQVDNALIGQGNISIGISRQLNFTGLHVVNFCFWSITLSQAPLIQALRSSFG
jgi:hypothetical protein